MKTSPFAVVRTTVLAGALAVGCAGGCGAGEATSPPPAPAVSAPHAVRAAPSTGWESGKWGAFHSQRFDLRLSLPDGKSWRIDDHKGSWLVATHAPSSSTLRLRMFLESHAQNRTKCEARVREADPSLPTPRADQAVDDAETGVLAGWDARAVSFVARDPKDATKLVGHVLVFASNVRKCLGFQLTTEASGATAKETIASRLAEGRERIVRELRFDQELGAPDRETLTAPSAARLSRRNSRHCHEPAWNSTQVVPRTS